MKKLFTVILAAGLVAPVFAAAPTPVSLAKKAKSLDEARGLIKQAIESPEFNQQAETYYVAGTVELDAYDKALATKAINPDDASVAITVMGPELIGAYNYFLQALPLDSLPNEKGQVKPKFSKEIYNKIKGHQSDFFNVGADYYEKNMYPEAYEAFYIYGTLPENFNVDKTLISDQQAATSLYYAGIAANQAGKIDESADAFKKSRLLGYEKPEATIFEIACWQTIAQQDNDRTAEAQEKIKEAAQFGIDNFGIENAIFLNNLVNAMVTDGQTEEALQKLNALIDANPASANLYGLRGYVYERLEKDDLSEADYRKGASIEPGDFETLKNASSKLYRIGAAKLNNLEGNSPEINAQRQEIKENYFIEAQNYANKANALNPGDPQIQSILDSIDYALTTFFN